MVDNPLQEQLKSIQRHPENAAEVAFFDLDKTLIAGYSIVALVWERIKHGVNPGELRQSVKILQAVLKQRKSEGVKSGNSFQRLVKSLAKSLEGVSEQVLLDLGEEAYINTTASGLYREAIALIEAHREAGHKLVIVSAASRYQVEPIARVLGIEEVCCTQLEVVDGKFTGKPITPLCYGEGKLMAARRVCRKTEASLENCWFYSDSSDDLPLLRKVGKPVAVNPSDTLKAYAQANHWPQLKFESRGLPTIESLFRTILSLQTLATTTAICAFGKRLNISAVTNANRTTELVGSLSSGFAGFDLEVEGAENLTRERPAIFIFNHQSLLDSMVLAHLLHKDIVGLCKKEMADNPLVGPLLRQVDTIFVDRDEKDQSAVLKKALAVLEGGRSLVIAPEGTRSTLGHIQPFKHGAFFLAKKAKVPVVPIVLHNVKDALPKGGFLIRPTTIRVTVLPPMHPASMGGVRQSCQKMEQDYCQVLKKSKIAALPYGELPKAS